MVVVGLAEGDLFVILMRSIYRSYLHGGKLVLRSMLCMCV